MTCLCCPANRCAILLCFFEILISVMIWYEMATLISQTFSVLQLKDVLILLFVSAWLITLFTSTFTLILAHKKQNPEFVLPRLVQQSGLLIVGFLMALLIVVYFSGGAFTINNIIINTYEGLMLEKSLTKDERREAHDSLKYCFMVLILLDFFFICYMAFGLSVTKKFHAELKHDEIHSSRRPQTTTTRSNSGFGPLTTGRPLKQPEFRPLKQTEPSAPPPPPPYNPRFII